jgi:HSP20 family protein
MTHLKHPFARPSVRGPYLPILKEFHYDRFLHSPWGHAFPPVNVKETSKSFEIELMVPGFDKTDFNISFDAEFLTVSVDSKQGDEKKEDNFSQKEFGYDAFSRSFHLPANANEEDIQAKYDRGVLKLTIAKKNTTIVKPKKSIEVL